MNKDRLERLTAIAAGLIFFVTASGPARADGAADRPMQAPTIATLADRQGPAADDDFAGLDLTAEQKAEMDKIHQGMEARKGMVAKDVKLTNDQKDAFILGYTRQEYGEMFRVLTPLQQKTVRKRMQDRRAADQAAHKKQPSTPRN